MPVDFILRWFVPALRHTGPPPARLKRNAGLNLTFRHPAPLSDREIRDVAVFVRSLQREAGRTSGATARGEQAYPKGQTKVLHVPDFMAHDCLEAVFPWADRPEREEFLDRYLNRAHYTPLPEEVKGENDEIQPTEI